MQRSNSIFAGTMKNVYKVVVLGSPKVGKTTLIEEAMYGNRVRLNGPYEPTLEDIYCVSVDIDSKTRDKMYLYDYSGVVPPLNLDTIKMYLSFCDAFILVFAINDKDSFSMMDQIKKNIEKFKEKKDIQIVVLANKIDRFNEYAIDLKDVRNWAAYEKLRHFEVTSTNRQTIVDALLYLATKLSHVPSKSSFSQLRKSKTGSIQLEL